MSKDTIQIKADVISEMLTTRLKIKGKSLSGQVSKLGRSVPKSVRRDAAKVLEAQQMAGHPKLARQVHTQSALGAADRVIEHLETIDPVDRMKGRVLLFLGKFSALLILGFVAAVWFAWDRGLI